MSHSVSHIELACLWEAYVAKPGNVHPGAAFADLCYDDFVQSAQAIAPVFARNQEMSVGELVFQSVAATHAAVQRNTNLGIILVLAPLARAALPTPVGVQHVLSELTVNDARLVYQAIRLAQPGGMGEVASQDVYDEPTITLLEAMRLAESRDLIARQYVTAYDDVFSTLLPELERHLPDSPKVGIQQAFLVGLATLGDTLIARKCGLEIAQEAQHRAQQVLQAGYPHTPHGHAAWDSLDCWLRADGHRRNPGTLADLLAATIYLALQRGTMPHVAVPEVAKF